MKEMDAAAMEALRRFDEAVQAFDRGACVEEATAELTLDLCDGLPEGDVKNVVRAALLHLAADPPRGNREAAVRRAHAALQAFRRGDAEPGS
ncbi:MAG TPA: hypothetical protein VF339_03250 [Gammaproteobacteria bacterium]